jgi:hypothetical protein
LSGLAVRKQAPEIRGTGFRKKLNAKKQNAKKQTNRWSGMIDSI